MSHSTAPASIRSKGPSSCADRSEADVPHDRRARGEQYRAPLLTERQWTWRMEKIEPPAGATADVFHVKFPPNTEISTSAA